MYSCSRGVPFKRHKYKKKRKGPGPVPFATEAVSFKASQQYCFDSLMIILVKNSNAIDLQDY